MIRKWAYIPALMATCMLPLHAVDIFVTPTSASSNTIGVYQANPLASAGTISGPAGAFQVLRASATKFYIISRAAQDAVTVWEGALPGVTQMERFNLPEPATAAAVSPDGRRVVVLAGNVYIFDTTADTNLTPTGLNAGASPSSLTISADSTRAFVVSGPTQRISAIDLSTNTVGNTATTPGAVSQIAAGPNGFIYATAINSLLEYDPRTLLNTNTYQLNAFPSAIAFTPDGRGAVLVNTNPVTGSSLIHVDLIRKSHVVAPPIGGGAVLEDVVVTNNNTAYAFSPQTGRLYSVALTPGSDAALALTPVTFGSVQVDGISDIATSTEVPAQYLLVTTPVGLLRRDAAGTTVGAPPLASAGNLSVSSAPITTGAAAVTPLIENQSMAVGQASIPLVVRVTDATGNPVANVPVAFAASGGAAVVNAMPQTNNQGIALGYLTPPSGISSGTINVTATATGVPAPAAFTITIGTGGGTGGTSTGGLQIVSGTGQALTSFQNTGTQEPLRVRLRDASGNPLSGVTVTWALTEGAGSLTTTTSTTDISGLATANFISSLVLGGNPFQTNIVTATAGEQSVTFYLTTLASLGTGSGPATLNSYSKQSSNIVEGRAGDTLPGAIQYDVVSPLGARLPFIGIRVETDLTDAEGNPAASCRGGTQLSDNAGVASCDLTISPSFIGETNLSVVIGSVRREPYILRVTQGAPAQIRLVQGSPQTGNTGQQLPLALVAQVVDSTARNAADVPVTWEVSPAGSATLSNVSSRTDVNGRASANVTLGQRPGAIQVRVTAGTVTGTFSLTINVPASQITARGGNNQTAVTGQAFAQPLEVLVTNAQGAPVQGTQVAFSVASGSTGAVILGSATAVSNAQGIASTTVAAGSTLGPVTVRAQAGTLTADFNLTVRAVGPGFTAASIVNAAGFQPGISPGTIAAISVTGVAPNPGTVTPPTTAGPLPTSLANVQVLFNGTPAPIFAVANINGQESVTVQVPFETAPGSATVTIRVTGGGETTVSGVPILAVKPGVFESVDASNQRYVVATRPDGSYVSAGNPARRGEIIRAYATGLGQTTPATGTNRLGQAGQNVIAPVIVGVNNAGVRLVSAQLLPGTVGVYFVEFEVPADTTPGNARPFAIAVVDGTSTVFGNGTTIPIL